MAYIADNMNDIDDIDNMEIPHEETERLMETERSTDQLTDFPKGKTVTNRLVLAIFTAVLGMFQFGWNTGVINAPQNVIEEFYNETFVRRTGSPIPDSTRTFLWAFTVAIIAAGGMIGALLGAWWADKFGRKGGMFWNTFFGIVSAALMGFSKMAGSYEMLIVGRFGIGFNCGLYTGLSPIYNSEVAPFNIRGAIGTLNQLAVTFGILLSQVLGLSEVLGNDRLWPLLLGLAAVAPILQLILTPFSPESPRYLLLTKGEKEAATDALIILRGTTNVHEELLEMEREQQQAAENQEEKVNMCQLCSVSSLRMPLTISIFMHLSQQFSGINCIFYYSTSLFINVGLDESTAKYTTLAVGAIMVVMTFISIPLMDRAGRRTLHLIGLGGMCISSIIFTITFYYATRTSQAWLQYVAIIFALFIVVFFAIGPGSIPWMIVAELFSQGPRPAAVSVSVLVNWMANFVVGQVFPPMQNGLKELVFIPFTVLLAIFFVWLYIYLPETKGKTIEEITGMFSKKTTPEQIQQEKFTPTSHEYGSTSNL